MFDYNWGLSYIVHQSHTKTVINVRLMTKKNSLDFLFFFTILFCKIAASIHFYWWLKYTWSCRIQWNCSNWFQRIQTWGINCWRGTSEYERIQIRRTRRKHQQPQIPSDIEMSWKKHAQDYRIVVFCQPIYTLSQVKSIVDQCLTTNWPTCILIISINCWQNNLIDFSWLCSSSIHTTPMWFLLL